MVAYRNFPNAPKSVPSEVCNTYRTRPLSFGLAREEYQNPPLMCTDYASRHLTPHLEIDSEDGNPVMISGTSFSTSHYRKMCFRNAVSNCHVTFWRQQQIKHSARLPGTNVLLLISASPEVSRRNRHSHGQDGKMPIIFYVICEHSILNINLILQPRIAEQNKTSGI